MTRRSKFSLIRSRASIVRNGPKPFMKNCRLGIPGRRTRLMDRARRPGGGRGGRPRRRGPVRRADPAADRIGSAGSRGYCAARRRARPSRPPRGDRRRRPPRPHGRARRAGRRGRRHARPLRRRPRGRVPLGRSDAGDAPGPPADPDARSHRGEYRRPGLSEAAKC